MSRQRAQWISSVSLSQRGPLNTKVRERKYTPATETLKERESEREREINEKERRNKRKR